MWVLAPVRHRSRAEPWLTGSRWGKAQTRQRLPEGRQHVVDVLVRHVAQVTDTEDPARSGELGCSGPPSSCLIKPQ